MRTITLGTTGITTPQNAFGALPIQRTDTQTAIRILRRAHAAALSDGFVGTDDSSLIERLGGRVLVVEGPRDNIKMTVPEDYKLMEVAVMKLYGRNAEL